MKKIIIALLLIILPSKVYAFKTAGFGFGPNLQLRGGVATNLLMDGSWNFHKNVGLRLFVGFKNGFWTGTALNTTFSVYENRTGSFDYSVNFSVPFMINIYNSVRTAFIGVTAGNTISISIDILNRYYLFITPAEFFFIPVVWKLYPVGGVDTGLQFSVMFSTGIKVKL
ncbi:MAG: hypothetical protein WCQ47_02370 [bacterium]